MVLLELLALLIVLLCILKLFSTLSVNYNNNLGRSGADGQQQKDHPTVQKRKCISSLIDRWYLSSLLHQLPTAVFTTALSRLICIMVHKISDIREECPFLMPFIMVQVCMTSNSVQVCTDDNSCMASLLFCCCSGGDVLIIGCARHCHATHWSETHFYFRPTPFIPRCSKLDLQMQCAVINMQVRQLSACLCSTNIQFLNYVIA